MKRRKHRLSVNVPQDDKELYVVAARRLGVTVSSFAGLLMAIGYNQVLENPEIIAKVMTE
jgi:hypothetical protein